MAERKSAKAVRFENPLMPDERLRQMYTAMVQMRLLEEHLRARKGAAKGAARLLGEEAVRASTALSLGAGDVLSDPSATPAMDLLLGARLRGLLGTKGGREATLAEGSPLRLPLAADAGEQMEWAAGAGLALKAQRGGRVLLVYLRAAEVKRQEWKRTLKVAGERELPIIFVAMPVVKGGVAMEAGELAAKSREWGVPGFPVDGSDAIALYRVMQESLLRARSDGGPALMECIRFDTGAKGGGKAVDPLERLGELLVVKGVASERWMERTRRVFGRRLGG